MRSTRQSGTSTPLTGECGCTDCSDRSRIVDEPPATVILPKRVALTVKDQPILRAAIHANCSHLLTGDRRHFGALFGRSVKGVRVVTVREYLTGRGIRGGVSLNEAVTCHSAE